MINKYNFNKIAFLGDQHGNTKNIYKLIDYIRDKENPDLLIQVGDFGLMGDNFEKYLFKINKKLKEYNLELWFIDGNHENFNWLLNKVANKHDLNEITSNIKYIPRGTLLNINDKNFYFCGGAFSIDNIYRTLNKTWWLQETLSNEETKELIDFYNKNYKNYTVDYFISHDTPLYNHLSNPNIFMNQSDYYKDYLHKRNLYELYELTKAPVIIHGHYHIRKSIKEDNILNITLNCDNSILDEQYTIVNTK